MIFLSTGATNVLEVHPAIAPDNKDKKLFFSF
jgi:hypothetical protein